MFPKTVLALALPALAAAVNSVTSFAGTKTCAGGSVTQLFGDPNVNHGCVNTPYPAGSLTYTADDFAGFEFYIWDEPGCTGNATTVHLEGGCYPVFISFPGSSVEDSETAGSLTMSSFSFTL